MEKKILLITGSLGLIGFESVLFYLKKGYTVIGVDNNFRQKALGIRTTHNDKLHYLSKRYPFDYIHYSYDLRYRSRVEKIFREWPLFSIIHTAGQTSHDWATDHAFVDCGENILSTLNLLELTRKFAPKAFFIFTSTNKVYGDLVNTLPYHEEKTRFDLAKKHPFYKGIPESFSVDRSLHSLFGVSKLAADMYVQEYGRHFGMKTACFRLGVVAGRGQNGALEQGFLSYLLKQVIAGRPIELIGYQGKQVRDIIAASDVVSAFYHFLKKPKSGVVYNMGGGRDNAYSILEILQKLAKFSKKDIIFNSHASPRAGDHRWWISDSSFFAREYPGWKINKSVDQIIEEMVANSYD